MIHVAVWSFVVVLAFPIVWMVITAIKQDADLYPEDAIPFWFKLPPTLANFDLLFNKTAFVDWAVNTVEVSVLVVLITLVVALPAGYSLARLHFPGSTTLGIVIFLTYLVPSSLLFIPLSQVVVLALHSLVTGRRPIRITGFTMVVGRGLSHVHNPIFGLADVRFLQDRAD